MLAHVESPDWIIFARSFDVVLMVALSAILCGYSYQNHIKRGDTTINWCFKRVERLVIPTWSFLVLYFLVMLMLGEKYSIKYYLESFMLTRYGIGYVWIILIYIYCALLIPIFIKYRGVRFSTLVATVYAVYEICMRFGIWKDSTVLNLTLFYIIPYGLITYIFLRYHQMKLSARIVTFVAAFVGFVVMGIYYLKATGQFQMVSIEKYPPRLYYIGYGVACSLALLLIFERFRPSICGSIVIKYISCHSMWIYLWHILALKMYDVLGLPDNWLFEFVVVFSSSVICVYIVNAVLDLVDKNRKISFLSYFRA